jgi:5-methylcytosine-specific restriction endonuclease McrA
MFALSEMPKNPELQPGELLLLQLVMTDAVRFRKTRERINFALVFDHLERDHDGSISRKHWPTEGRTWNWIVYGSATVPTIPFSLEHLNLSKNYTSQNNARYIDPIDEAEIRPLVLWSLSQKPDRYMQLVDPTNIAQTFGKDRALTGVFNHDRIAILTPPSKSRMIAEQFNRNQWLAETLKSYYEYRCQVCGNDFQPRYGTPFAESHHVQYLRHGGPDISGNVVVLCPNHHRIIHATNAEFDRPSLEYKYPNGLRERLILPDHLAKAPEFDSEASNFV